jgi:hypothetical protein
MITSHRTTSEWTLLATLDSDHGADYCTAIADAGWRRQPRLALLVPFNSDPKLLEP